jgi:hypothetical protein
MSFQGEQQKIDYNGSRKKFSVYISVVWPDENLMKYDFYDKMNSINTINHMGNLYVRIMKTGWKRLILIWDNASYHVSRTVLNYINEQKDWMTIIHLLKKAPYLNPNERKGSTNI